MNEKRLKLTNSGSKTLMFGDVSCGLMKQMKMYSLNDQGCNWNWKGETWKTEKSISSDVKAHYLNICCNHVKNSNLNSMLPNNLQGNLRTKEISVLNCRGVWSRRLRLNALRSIRMLWDTSRQTTKIFNPIHTVQFLYYYYNM